MHFVQITVIGAPYKDTGGYGDNMHFFFLIIIEMQVIICFAKLIVNFSYLGMEGPKTLIDP